jgi:uncharacterized membrane protein YtjA (UPF0391 family)
LRQTRRANFEKPEIGCRLPLADRTSRVARADSADLVGKGGIMLDWSLSFFVLALIAAVLGFGGLAAEMAWIGKVLFLVFLVLFVVARVRGKRGEII